MFIKMFREMIFDRKRLEFVIHGNILQFDKNFNKPLNDYYYKIISKYSILSFCLRSTGIFCDGDFNQPITLTVNLREVHFGFHFNQCLTLSKNLVLLSLSVLFNKPLILSKNQMVLITGNYFNQNIFLTKNLEDVVFKHYFDKPLILPKNLLRITLSENFNHPLILTKKLVYVHIGAKYNQPLKISKYCVRLNIYSSKIQSLILTKYIKEMCISSECANMIVFETKISMLNIDAYTTLTNDGKIEKCTLKYLDNIPNCLISEIYPSIHVDNMHLLNNLPNDTYCCSKYELCIKNISLLQNTWYNHHMFV